MAMHLTFQCETDVCSLFYGMPGAIPSFNVVYMDSVVIIVLEKKPTRRYWYVPCEIG